MTNETEQTAGLDFSDLSKLVNTRQLQTEIEYKDGLTFKLRYVSRADLNRVTNQCITRKWDSKAKQAVPRLDTDKLVTVFCDMAVLGWSGAKVRVLRGLMPMVLPENVTEAQLDLEVPFSQGNLVTLMKNCFDLDEFLQNAACDIKNFDTSQQEAELGN